MSQAKHGDTVAIHYTGRLDDGTVFDTSRERGPLEFKLGEGKVIPGFEAAVEGMALGEAKTTEVPSGEAYGPRREDLVMTVPREKLPDNIDPEVGQKLEMTTGDGQTVPVAVTSTDPQAIVIDANHPLAGRDLTFEIELVSID